MNVLFILNGSPYGTEDSFHGLGLAEVLAKREDVTVRAFLLGDAVGCAVEGQKLPDGFYHLDRMASTVIRRGGEIACCGTCMDARAIGEDRLVAGARRSSLEELAGWVLQADRVVSF